VNPIRIGPALLRFHLAAGARVALRTLVPVAVAVVAAAVMYGSPAVVIGAVVVLLYPASVSIGSAVLAAVVCVAIAASSAPRLTLGLTGWVRHLPASAVAHRRAVTAGLTVVQGPVLAIVLVGGLIAVDGHPSTTLPRLLGLVPLAWASALAALRVERGWVRVVAVAAAVAAWAGGWLFLLASAALVLVADTAAGPIVGRTRRPIGRRRLWFGTAGGSAGGAGAAARLWAAVSIRALGWRIASSWIPGLLALVPALLFLLNNRLTPGQQGLAVRLAGMTAVVLVISVLADALVKRRPPWPWVRSLPWSATLRVSLDAVLLGVVALPVLAATAFIEPLVILPLLAALPVLALRGSAAIRQAPGRASGASGQLLLEGGFAAGLVALVPWAPLLLLASVPPMVMIAADRERRQEISRWHELHYLAAGDPLSWSDA
jgi:hypothetical protein